MARYEGTLNDGVLPAVLAALDGPQPEAVLTAAAELARFLRG